jgi:hypothetical protein
MVKRKLFLKAAMDKTYVLMWRRTNIKKIQRKKESEGGGEMERRTERGTGREGGRERGREERKERPVNLDSPSQQKSFRSKKQN